MIEPGSAPRPVAVRLDCAAFFWCEIVARRRAASWYAVLPRVQSAYALAASELRMRGCKQAGRPEGERRRT